MKKSILSLLFIAASQACFPTYAEIAQEPLYLGAGNVPGNLAIVPSVEFPTVNSVANLDPNFSATRKYVGYFDSNKCYDYVGSSNADERRFEPVSITSDMKCSGPYWSGNYLNWATTQTIDPFRLALTGGLRFKDTASETWVEKARHDGQGGYFPTRTVWGRSLVAEVTPFNADSITTNINGYGKQMQFTLPAGSSLISGQSQLSTVLEDMYDFDNDDWTEYRGGELDDVRRYEGRRNTVRKSSNSDPAGGYAELDEDIGVGFKFTGWFAADTDGSSAKNVRLAISDDNANGYGFNISTGSIGIERRDAGSGTSISNSVNWSRSEETWYYFEFESNGGNTYTLSIYDEDGNNQLASVTSNSDSTYTRFSRVYIHGGHTFYADDLDVDGYAFTESQWPYENSSGGGFEATVRVKVCDPAVGVESNCVQYSQGWKPEGLLQEYANRIRYSVFGYLNDSNMLRDGGVMRASQKFIGQLARNPNTGWVGNSGAEWNAVTGQLIQNPDQADASSTQSYYGVTVNDSGVINYINKFGELNSNNFKSFDPVSELYYTATRYFRGLGRVPSYDTKSPAHESNPRNSTLQRWVDGFPVIRTWDDPIQYTCQKNVILGIGDVYTHRDKNLPGSTSTNDEPAKPSEVSNDNDVDVIALTNKVASLEGININTGNQYTGRANSAFMVGLAYDANTRDIRSDLSGKQTIQTYWVDVLENQILEGISRNQYWLAAKYGGLTPRCPQTNPTCTPYKITGPYDLDAADIQENWWYTNSDVLTQSNRNIKRTDNYYAAGDAENMVGGLRKAFSDIAAEMLSTATSLSINTNRIRSGSYIFQSLFDSTRWSGDLVAFPINPFGLVATTESWSAAEALDSVSDLTSRTIITPEELGSDSNGDGFVSVSAKTFVWDNLSASQRALLQKDDEIGGTVSTTVASERVDYLRGDRSGEVDDFRKRDSRLGDIINSDPQFMGGFNYGYTQLSNHAQYGSTIGTAYSDFRASTQYKDRKSVVVVGANDGMLHVFSAEGSDAGKELLGYVPAGVYASLYKLTKPDYVHQYYVDGTPRIADAWLGIAKGWRTVAVTTTGAGGSSVFAIDITNPAALGVNSFLWEFTHPKMGKLVQQPAVVALPNGDFGVVVTSGYEAPQSESFVWILDAATGSEVAEFEIPSGGLGSPFVVDIDRDRVADRIYVAGDDGKVWRLDLDGSNTNQWGFINDFKQGNNPLPLFSATDKNDVAQSITAPLNGALTDSGDVILLFGTGSYFKVNDTALGSPVQVNTFYGIYDTGSPIPGRSSLVEQSIIAQEIVGDYSARIVSQNSLAANDDGWFLDLEWQTADGERVVSRASVQGQEVIFSTLIPSSDPCEAGGDSWIMSLTIKNGGRSAGDFFDFNDDGTVNSNDSVEVTIIDEDGNEVTVTLPASGIKEQPGSGIIKSPAVVTSESGKRYVCFAGSSDTTPKCILISGGVQQGRQSWRELLED